MAMPTQDATTAKIGRNAPCPCGSGRKYKRCHGAVPGRLPRGIEQAAFAAFQLSQAREVVRTKQQGYGKPIISAMLKDHRIVCVSNRVLYSASWKFFPDFLFDYLKDSLGREWGAEAEQRGLDHPVLRWFRRMQALTIAASSGTGRPIVHKQIGFLTALLQFAYSLYLLEHHDQLPRRLISRLRVPSEFRPALHETVVASAFALAGYKIEVAEVAAADVVEPEFWATGKSGKKYAVEAKCRTKMWAASDPLSWEFRAELIKWFRQKIIDSSKKELTNPIFWFELSIPNLRSEKDARIIGGYIREAVDAAEISLSKRDSPPQPAYIFATNSPQFINDDVQDTPQFAVLEGFMMPDFPRSGSAVSLEDGFTRMDRHRDATWVFECLSEIQRVPQTFDGSVPELSQTTDLSRQSLQIGHPIEIEFPDQSNLRGTLAQITAAGDTAWVVVEQGEGKHAIATLPLTAEEATAAGMYGDAVFGRPEKKRKPTDTIFQMYDWLLDTFGKYDREALLLQISGHPMLSEFAMLAVPELRIRVAREVAKQIHATATFSGGNLPRRGEP